MKKLEVIPENVSKYMEEAATQRGQITPQQQLQQQQAQQLYLQQQMSQGQVPMGMMSGNNDLLQMQQLQQLQQMQQMQQMFSELNKK
jgi:hypothetical protein